MKEQQFTLKHTAANNKQKLTVKSENTCLKSMQYYASFVTTSSNQQVLRFSFHLIQ